MGISLSFLAWLSTAGPTNRHFLFIEASLPSDTSKGKVKSKGRPDVTPSDRYGDPYSNKTNKSPLIMDNPSNIETEVELDSSLNHFIIREKIGEMDYRPPTTMTYNEYYRYRNRQMLQNYWKNRNQDPLKDQDKSSGPFSLKIPVQGLEGPFGSNYVDIRPNGLVTLDFGGKFQRVENPSIPIRQQRNGSFDFDQHISMNVTGKIGEKLKLTANWDTKATFDFQNNLKLEYTGFEEDIIQKIEAGTVSMPINSTLISGAQNLFGIKTKLQFGRLSVTSVLSSQRGKTEELRIQGGAQAKPFEIQADNYDDYRHFFLAHFFRDKYENALKDLPIVNSNVKITRVDVYITNRTTQTQNLNDIIAYIDLGESARILNKSLLDNPSSTDTLPADNNVNKLRDFVDTTTLAQNPLDEWVKGRDYEIINSARKLTDRDFKFHPDLGYISLVAPLRPDEVLAVAFEYSYNGKVYKVGQLNEDIAKDKTKKVVLKLLKPSTIKTRLPTWDLMMKNIYQLGATQISRENFNLRVIYKDDLTGADLPHLQEGENVKNVALLKLTGLDRLNPNNDPYPDGNFDFVEDVTIDTRYGRVIFPVLEPFGENLIGSTRLNPDMEGELISKYVYSELYDSTKSDAQLVASKNKFFLVGKYQSSSSSEIILPGINIAPGSVVVTAGSNQLVEGQDYTIDYNLGRLKIINEGVLISGNEIKVRFEKQDLFNFRRKSFMGTRFDYQVSKDFTLGSTILHQNEAPTITRVNIGDEPSSNTIWGVDANFRKESRILTKIIDRLPLIQTKVPSSISFSGEVAQLIPGHSKAVDKGSNGTAYIDDFEGAE
ncbi:MAG TPA: cell surface protein SprA, partial [Cytophagaceae bacterium]